MSPDKPVYVPDNEAQQKARGLVNSAEQQNRYREQYPTKVKRAEDFIYGLGGTKLVLPLTTIPSVIAKLGDHPLHNHTIHFSAVDQKRGFNRRIFNVHNLQTLVELNPKNYELWERNSEQGKIHEGIYTQDIADDEYQTLSFPNGIISFSEDTFRIHFTGVSPTRIIPNPDPMGFFGFETAPAILSRAWRVYKNILKTKMNIPSPTLNMFDPSIAIEFTLVNPRHGKPISV